MKITFPKAILILLSLFVLQVIIGVIISIPLAIFSSVEKIDQMVLSVIIVPISYILTIQYLVKSSSLSIKEYVSFKNFPLAMLWFLVFAPLIYVLNVQINELIFRFVEPGGYFYDMLMGLAEVSFSTVVLVLLVAPVFEELLFRGVILPAFLSQYSQKMSVALSSILFSLYHINPYQFLPTFILGVTVSIVFIRSRSVILCILFHMLYNSVMYLYL
jgi:uncharacterized protein